MVAMTGDPSAPRVQPRFPYLDRFAKMDQFVAKHQFLPPPALSVVGGWGDNARFHAYLPNAISYNVSNSRPAHYAAESAL